VQDIINALACTASARVALGLVLVLAIAGCGAPAPSATLSPAAPATPAATVTPAATRTTVAMTPEEVARAWVDATNENDVDALVELFQLPARARRTAAESYVDLTTQAELRTWLASAPAGFAACRRDVVSITTSGDVVTIVATLTPVTPECPFESGREISIQIEVRDGKITTLG
jgi:hypothetical protein